jgi:hypothetical protein
MIRIFRNVGLSLLAIWLFIGAGSAWAQLRVLDDLYLHIRTINKYKNLAKSDFLLLIRSAGKSDLAQIVSKLPLDKRSGALLDIAQERGILKSTDALYLRRYVNNVPNYDKTLLKYVSDNAPDLNKKVISDLHLVRNQGLAGARHPVTNIPFDSNGFPIFDSRYDISLPASMYKKPVIVQFEYATAQLAKEIDKNPALAKIFSPKQIEQIRKGYKPEGLTWHHHQSTGKLQLVDSKIHQKTGHTGGTAIWGSGGSCE